MITDNNFPTFVSQSQIDFDTWKMELQIEMDRKRKEWNEYKNSEQYLIENQYILPIGPTENINIFDLLFA